MTDETAASWPEQDAVDAWMEERGFYVSHEATMALKTAVTAERIRQQRAFLQARADRDHLAADLSAAQAQIEALRGAVDDADSALTEAEAILGGEYGDHYGPLCEMMLGLRAKIAALPAKEGE